VLVYGESGVGKTTLALEIVREACTGMCFYTTTERLDFLKRAVSMNVDLAKIVVYEAVDANDFLDILTYRLLPRYDIVVVDSINNFIYEGVASYIITGLLAASLHAIAERYGLLVVETAQVRWKPGEGLQPAGSQALDLWADRKIELTFSENVDGARVARVDGETFEYRIGREGIIWLNC
jgi:predicted ATP-dependent serine protease